MTNSMTTAWHASACTSFESQVGSPHLLRAARASDARARAQRQSRLHPRLSYRPSVGLSVHLSTCLCLSLPVLPRGPARGPWLSCGWQVEWSHLSQFCLSVGVYACPACASVRPLILLRPPVHPTNCPPVCRTLQSTQCPPACESVCAVRPSLSLVHPSARPSICRFIFPSVGLSICPPVCPCCCVHMLDCVCGTYACRVAYVPAHRTAVTFLLVHLSVSLSSPVRLTNRPPLYPPARLSTRPTVHLPVNPIVHSSTCPGYLAVRDRMLLRCRPIGLL